MRVLITGANGFLGQNLRDVLQKEYDLVLTARREGNGAACLDLGSDELVDKFISGHKGYGIDAIVHTAGKLVDSDMTQQQQFEVFDANISITKNIVKLVQSLQVGILINCSSIAVYPNEDGEYREQSEIRTSVNTECMYGLSKFCAENIFDFMLRNTCKVANLRLAQIYGKGMRADRTAAVMRQSVMKNNTIVVYGKGERVSNFIDVLDVCGYIDKILKLGGVSGIYNVGDENLSYYELAGRVKKEFGNADTRIITKDAGSRAKFYLDTKKIERLFKSTDK